MKFIILALICIFLTSCVAISQDSSLSANTTAPSKKPLIDIYKIRTDMSRQEIRAILKDDLLIGYQINSAPEKLDPITVAQPYREEVFPKDGKVYHVLYFYGYVIRPDGLIAEDELIPLVLEGDRLVGKGLADLDRIKRM